MPITRFKNSASSIRQGARNKRSGKSAIGAQFKNIPRRKVGNLVQFHRLGSGQVPVNPDVNAERHSHTPKRRGGKSRMVGIDGVAFVVERFYERSLCPHSSN